MKKIYLIIIAMAILLAGCMMGSEKAADEMYSEEDTIMLETLMMEEVQPEYAVESAPIMEIEMVEEKSVAMKVAAEPDALPKQDTPKIDKSELTPVSVRDTSKILKRKNDDLSSKELKFKKEVQNQYKQEEIDKNLDKLEEQQMKLDSLLKKKKGEEI